MTRQNLISALVADRGKGKTPFIIGDKTVPVEGIVESYLNRDMKFLILDTVNHSKYRHIPRIEINQIKFWKKGVYRFWGNRAELKKMLVVISQELFNAGVACEDAHKYIDTPVPDALIDFLIDTKEKNIDFFFLYHAFGWIPKDLYRVIDAYEIFKSSEHPKVRKEQLSGCYEKILKVWEEVNASENNYLHKTVFV
jgi:hypothetical protein